MTFLALAHVRCTNTTIQAVSLALLLKIVNEGGIEWKKKNFQVGKILLTFLYNHFFLLSKNRLFLDELWSNFLFWLGPICRFRTNNVIFKKISNS